MLEFITDFWGFLRTRKKLWLLPMLVSFGLTAGPFIYTIF